MASPFPYRGVAPPTMLRFSAILKLQHNGGDEGLHQWRRLMPISKTKVRKNKIDLWHFEGCRYSVPAVIPELAAGLHIADVRNRLWDRTVERVPAPQAYDKTIIMAHAAWFCPMVPTLIDAGLKPIIFLYNFFQHHGTMPCYELLGFQKEADMVAATVILDEMLPPR